METDLSKMSNYRTQLKSHGLASELMVNTLKSKSREDPIAYPAKNIKKARRGKSNHYPSQPSSETPESLKEERTSLLTEVKKRKNEKTVRENGQDLWVQEARGCRSEAYN